MRTLLGLVAILVVFLLFSAVALAQVQNPGVIRVIGDRMFIEQDMGRFTLVWAGSIAFAKPSPAPLVVTVKYELSPLGAWQERGTSSTIVISSRTVGARYLRERIPIASTESSASKGVTSLFGKDQVVRLSISVRRPGAGTTVPALAEAEYQLKPLGYALLNAARSGSVNEAKELLDEGVDVDSASIDSFTPLMMASAAGHTDVVRLLIDKGASVKISTKGSPFVESALGARIPGGWNALMAAALSGKTEIVKLLLDKKAAVNSATEDRRTPLLVAVEGRNPAVVKLLLDRGADPNALSDLGYSPLSMADIYGKGAIAGIIASRGGRITVPWDILTESD
jgi:uncharacterized protein